MSSEFSIHCKNSLEAPDVTGCSLTLGTAGSRRTVYLIDENQKIPETNQSTSSSLQAVGAGGSSNSSSTATLSPVSNNNSAEPQTSTGSSKPDNPATFLMYNRINNIVGGNSMNQVNNEAPSGSVAANNRDVDAQQDQDNKLKKRTEDKNNSIWYEYGCV